MLVVVDDGSIINTDFVRLIAVTGGTTLTVTFNDATTWTHTYGSTYEANQQLARWNKIVASLSKFPPMPGPVGAPTIVSLTPNTASHTALSGFLSTLVGTNLDPSDQVKINSIPLSWAPLYDDVHGVLDFTSLVGTGAGVYDVVIAGDNGTYTLVGGFTIT